MNKLQWMQKEISMWEKEEMISQTEAEKLRSMYQPIGQTNTLIIIFAIIGSILIGAGIILIGAKNWYTLPIWLRTAIAFSPLVLAQGLTAFTMKNKMQSIPWREGASIFHYSSVFFVIAMIGQIFHLPGNFDVYVLLCGLLGLPLVYLLQSVGSSIIYLWSILVWCGMKSFDYSAHESFEIYWIFALLALLAPFVTSSIRHHILGIRSGLLALTSAIAGYFVMLFLTIWVDNDIHTALFVFILYAVVLYAVDAAFYKTVSSYLHRPLKILGSFGIIVIMYITSYGEIWTMPYNKLTRYYPVLSLCVLGILMLALILAVSIRRLRNLDDILMVAFPLCICAPLVWMSLVVIAPYMLMAIIVNLMLLCLGLLMVLKGVKGLSISTANVGMLMICLQIVLRFFDWQMDFLFRGIAFLILGIGFLMLNLHLVKKKKAVI